MAHILLTEKEENQFELKIIDEKGMIHARCTLSHSVTLQRGNESDGQELLGLPTNLSSTTHREPQVTPRSLLNSVEDDQVRQSRHDALATKVLFNGESTVEDGRLESASRLDFGEDTLADQFPDGGDSNHDGGAEGSDVSDTVTYGSIGEGLDGSESERSLVRIPKSVGHREGVGLKIPTYSDEKHTHLNDELHDVLMVAKISLDCLWSNVGIYNSRREGDTQCKIHPS